MSNSISFTISGRANTIVTITELDNGALLFDLVMSGGGSKNGLRGFFFDLPDEISPDSLAVSSTGAPNPAGNGPHSLSTRGPFDAGVDFGGKGGARLTSTSFELSSSDGPLSLSDFSFQDIGVRLARGGWDGRGDVTVPGYAVDDTLIAGEAIGGSVNLFANDTIVLESVVTGVIGSAGPLDLIGGSFQHTVDRNGGEIGTLTVSAEGDATFTSSSDVLGDGETVELALEYQTAAPDGSTATADFLLTVFGANNAPDISVEPGDLDVAVLLADLQALDASGTLTISDADRTDTVSVALKQVATGGDNNSPNLPDLQTFRDMFALSPSSVLDGTETAGQFNWKFKASDEEFSFLQPGETIFLFYDIEAADAPASGASGMTDTHTVTVQVSDIGAVPISGRPTANADEMLGLG